MEGLPPIPIPAKGSDLLEVVTSDLIKSLAGFQNAPWTVSTGSSNNGTGKFLGSQKAVVLDLSQFVPGYKQSGQMFISGQIYNVVFCLGGTPTAVTP